MKIVLHGYALLFLVQGIGYLLWPGALFGLIGGTLDAGAVTTDVRATYGGVHIGIAALILFRNGTHHDRLIILDLLTCLVASVAAIRAVGVWVDGGQQLINLLATGIEGASVVLTAVCAAKLRRDARKSGD